MNDQKRSQHWLYYLCHHSSVAAFFGQIGLLAMHLFLTSCVSSPNAPEIVNTKASCHVYVASPYGFADCTRKFMNNELYPVIRQAECEVIDPWRNNFSDPMRIGEQNANDIKKADGIVACLDGVDVDSGTAAEIGYAAAQGKWIIGYRTDWRKTGESKFKVTVNLQVEYFIYLTGGKIVRKLEDLAVEIRKRART